MKHLGIKALVAASAPRLMRGIRVVLPTVAFVSAACDRPDSVAVPPASTQPSSTETRSGSESPATRPAATPVVEAAKPLRELIDVVLATDPDFPTTRPLDLPVDLSEAARHELDGPVLLDGYGNLWLTHERGEDPADVVRGPLDRQTFVVNAPVAFALWVPGHDGKPAVELVVEAEDGSYRWLHRLGSVAIPAPPDGASYRWSGAFGLGRRLVVPTTGGAAVLTATDRQDVGQYLVRYARTPQERRPSADGGVELAHVKLAGIDAAASAGSGVGLPRTQIALDGRGLLAWVPWSMGQPGDRPPARWLEGSGWTELDASAGWSGRVMHLVPLVDGTVLQIAADAGGEGDVRSVLLDAGEVDASAVRALVAKLDSDDPRERETAFAELSGFGPGSWPILSDLLDEQSPAVQGMLRMLLGDQQTPTLGGMMLEPGEIAVRQRLADGGVILVAKNGVLVPDMMGVYALERPAWIAVRPGRVIERLPDMLRRELEADDDARLFVWGDEWIISRPGLPPRRWLLNHNRMLLPEAQAEWQWFVGRDRVGRWIFRQDEAEAPAQQPTLVADVRLPDPTPRLPVWVLQAEEGEAGWDDADWPVTKLVGAWRLLGDRWEPLPKDAKVHVEYESEPGAPLAIGEDGMRVYGGETELTIERPDGTRKTWPLPEELVASHPPQAVIDAKGRIFLFNHTGRVVRLRGEDEGLKVEGVFTDRIPQGVPRRVWIDPAGRVCAAYFGDQVAVMFPGGTIPPEIRLLMPSDAQPYAPPTDIPQGI